MLKGISRYANLRGPWTFYRQLPFYQHSKPPGRAEKALPKIIRQWRPHGIILEAPPVETPEAIIPPSLPAVFVPTLKLVRGFPNVVDNDGRCGCIAAENFLNRGFENLAYCGYAPMYWSQSRAKSFGQRARLAGLQVHTYDQPISRMSTLEEEKTCLINWLAALPKPVGLFVCNDDRAEHIFDACKSSGLRIPEDVALMGVDNDDLICNFSTPPLSSIELSLEKCGYEMAEVLHHQMVDKGSGRDHIALDTLDVHTRQSTDIIAIENPDLVTALTFIRQHATDRIGTDQVVQQASVSRRMLERYFRHHLGRTIHQEILRVQMRAVEERLLKTDLPATKIARDCGFATPEYMGQVFKRYHNMTMLQFRRKKV